MWDTVKIFNGLDINQYKNNLPQDKIIDQIQIIHYTATTLLFWKLYLLEISYPCCLLHSSYTNSIEIPYTLKNIESSNRGNNVNQIMPSAHKISHQECI